MTPISLDALIENSQKFHPENEIFDQRISATKYLQFGMTSIPNPMISYEEMKSSGMNPMTESIWEFRQKLSLPFKYSMINKIYSKDIESIKIEKDFFLKNRLANLKIEYFRWLSLHRKIAIKKEQETLLTQLIAVQKTRYISQKVTQVEVVALQIERGLLIAELSSLEIAKSNQRSIIQLLTGPGLNLDQTEPKNLKLNLAEIKIWSVSDLESQIEESNLELNVKRKIVEKSEFSLSQKKENWIPDLELMLTKREDSIGNKKFGWQIGFEIPLWLGGEQRGNISQAKANSIEAKVQFDELKRKIFLDVQAKVFEQKQLRQQLEIMENGLLQWSRQNVLSARTAYQTGKLEYSGFLALMQSSFQTLNAYEDLKVKALESQEQLDLLLGSQTL